jgi:intein/homing endonuclease
LVSIYSALKPPFSGDPDAPGFDGVWVLRPFDFTWHCVAAGTSVTLADGGSKPIEDLVGGEEVRTPDGGALIVNDTYVFAGDRAIIELEDDRGRTLRITERHAVFTENGPIIAKELRAGDVVNTEDGRSALVRAEVVPYEGLVYGINVGRGIAPEELRREQMGFFAGGLAIADNALSRDVAATARKRLETILAELPPEWHQDARNTHAGVG